MKSLFLFLLSGLLLIISCTPRQAPLSTPEIVAKPLTVIKEAWQVKWEQMVASHPKAARVFANWLLTKEVQTFYSRIAGVQSSREDVPTDHLSPITIRQQGVPYFETWKEDFLLTSAERLKMGQELFGPYVK